MFCLAEKAPDAPDDPLQLPAFVASFLGVLRQVVMFVHGQIAMPQAVLFTLKQFHVVLVTLKPMA